MTVSSDNVMRTDNLKASTRLFHEKVEQHEMGRIMIEGKCDRARKLVQCSG